MFGIRYCGGCNPHYDRVRYVEKIKKYFEGEEEFELAQEGVEYDGILVIGGCSNCCAAYKQFSSLNPGKKIWGEEFFDETVEYVRSASSKNK